MDPATNFGPNWWTPPESAAVAPWGWTPLDDTYEIAHTIDTRIQLPNGAPLFARLTYAGALALAARERAALISPDQLAELHARASVELPPITLPDAQIRASARGILARRDGETAADWDQRLRNAGMTSEAWAAHHDERLWAQLCAGSAGQPCGFGVRGALIANVGKSWVAGAPPGRAWLMGWWTPRTGWIQPMPHPGDHGFHDDSHHDYATTTILVSRRDGQPMPTQGDGSPLGGAIGGAVPGSSSSSVGWALGALGLVLGVSLGAWYASEHWPEIRRRIG